MPGHTIKARSIEPMLLERAEKLSEGGLWMYELKLDGLAPLSIRFSPT
jgi:hypothetical protein